MSAHSASPAPAHRDAIPPPPSGLRSLIDVGALRERCERAEQENAALRARVAQLEAEVAELTRPTVEDVRT